MNIFDCDLDSFVGVVLSINVKELCCFFIGMGSVRCNRLVSDLFDIFNLFYIEVMFREVMVF